MPTVRLRVTTFNVEDMPASMRPGFLWDAFIQESIRMANRILRQAHVRVRLSNRMDLAPQRSRQLLTADVLIQAGGQSRFEATLAQHHREGVREYQRLKRTGRAAPHYLYQEYFAQVASVEARRVGQGMIGSEARAILGENRASGEVCTYWVPGISCPSQAAGETVFAPFYSHVAGLEGILISRHARSDTLAHEFGHLLMRISHCSRPDQHRPECQCAGRDNLMHRSGNQRTGTDLTREQRDRIRDRGGEWFS